MKSSHALPGILLCKYGNPKLGSLGVVSIKGPFLPTCGFSNQGKSLVMFSFRIPPVL